MMDKIKKNINKIVTGIVIIFVITFIYNYTKNTENPAGIDEQVLENSDTVAMEIVSTLNQLSKIQIDKSFFSEDLSYNGNNLISFYDLKDFSKSELPEKPRGKNNPFLTKNSLGNSNQEENSLEE